MIPNGPTSVYNGPAYVLQMQLTMCFLCLLYFQFYMMCKTVFISVICLMCVRLFLVVVDCLLGD